MRNVILASFLVLVFIAFTPIKSVKSGYTIGDSAADFSLKNVDGKMVSLADFDEAKGFIVVFTCNHCPYAIAYEDRIIALDKKYKALGYPVIAINPNDPKIQPKDSYEKMIERAENKGFTFPYLFDDGQNVMEEFGATRTPHVFILNKEKAGNVVKYIGAIDDYYDDAAQAREKYVEDALNALIAGSEVVVKETKAIGCSIKKKKK